MIACASGDWFYVSPNVAFAECGNARKASTDISRTCPGSAQDSCTTVSLLSRIVQC